MIRIASSISRIGFYQATTCRIRFDPGAIKLKQTIRNAHRTFSCSTQIASNAFNGSNKSLEEEYNMLVKQGKLLFDQDQQRVAKKFTRLQGAMNGYNHSLLLKQLKDLDEYNEAEPSRKSEQESDNTDETKQKFAERAPPEVNVQIPRGIYLYGDVGTGKSLLMNMFFAASPLKKRRLHFHSLLSDIHSRIFQLNKQILATHGRSFHVDTSKDRNPIIQIAQQLSTEVTLLCIDEFQVTDVADAMILSQLFGELWRHGVVVVATSNRPPKDLYEDGLNRSYFLPFIDLLERYCLVLRLGTHHESNEENESARKPIDYRRIKSGIDETAAERSCGDFYFLTSTGSETSEMLDQLFRKVQVSNLSPEENEVIREQVYLETYSNSNNSREHLTLQVKFQRNITISRYHSNLIARFTFEELCMTELGSSDYQAIANNFQIVMIEKIPQLTLKDPDRARRFITLVDELYESGCCLICSADEIPDNLFVGKSSTEIKSDEIGDDMNETKDMLAVDVAQVQGRAMSELASVKELSFAFKRAASRLLEMCSKNWWAEKGVVLSEHK